MAFVLEIELIAKKEYIRNSIVNLIREFGINTHIEEKETKIIFVFDSEHEKLQECLESIAQKLPASIFLKDSKNYESEEIVESLPEIKSDCPLNLGLCPNCQKELFDPSSRRYYYPFISCNSCGGNYSFLKKYPYERANTSFKFLRACSKCEDEMQSSGLKEKHYINSCHECAPPVRLVNKSSERYANDAGSFRTMFEVAAKAIADDKKLLMKTTFGHRLFYKASQLNKESIIMMINASKITDNLSLITEEFQALLSIERPILNVTLKSEELKELTKNNTGYVKYPEDGFSILLCVELQKLGFEYIAYEEADEYTEADIKMDYDLEVNSQKDLRVFLNKDVMFLAEGERVSFPSVAFESKNILSVAHDFVSVAFKGKTLFDKMEKFDSVHVDKANVLEGDEELYHSQQRIISQDEASFMSVIAEHNLFSKKCVGAYFDEEPSFLYYDGKNSIRIVPPKPFDTTNLLQNMTELREGSDRLVVNFKTKMPEAYAKLEALQTRDDVKLFEATAILLGLEDESMRGVVNEAMKFVGKGGLQIDTHVKDNRFDHIAFLTSIISYQLADVSTAILSYSIFESFGDYFSELLGELKSKTKATEIVLCGTHFANQSLFSRMQRNLKQTPPHMNINYPIGKENAVVGGLFL
ncbi:hypothetical protein [Sulfurimonas sp.]|uniref:hypothetical protein n=1 Tax=Sulfurimonas sp. TaxID=2022749 RepID=UPI0026375C2F|nr:hypothetical protein [Sulfurimonas sp.]